MKNKSKKGFTLIELLVVVAVIGVMAAVVLAALTSARNKGNDAGIQANLRNANAQAEIYWNTNTSNPGTYTSVCSGTVAANGALGIGTFVLAAAKDSGLGSVTTNGTGTLTTATCNDSATAWAAEVPLKSKGANQMWCIDSTGKAKQESATIGAGTACS